MKNMIYVAIVGAFIAALFGCGASTVSLNDAEQIIQDRVDALKDSAGTLVAEQATAESVFNMTSALPPADACVSADAEQAMLKASAYDCVPQGGTIPAAPQLVAGDMNKDGKFTSADLLFALNVLKGTQAASLDTMMIGNVNNDGAFDALDWVVMLRRIYKGLAEFPLVPGAKSGDLNKDGQVTAADIILMANYVHKGAYLDERGLIAGDINVDGVVNATDLDLLIDFMYYHNPVTALPFTSLGSFSLVASGGGGSKNPPSID